MTEIDPQTTLQVTRHTWAKYGSSNHFQIYTTLKQERNSFLMNDHPKTAPRNLCRHFERRCPKRGSKPPNLLVQPVSLPKSAENLARKRNNKPSFDRIYICGDKNQFMHKITKILLTKPFVHVGLHRNITIQININKTNISYGLISVRLKSNVLNS